MCLLLESASSTSLSMAFTNTPVPKCSLVSHRLHNMLSCLISRLTGTPQCSFICFLIPGFESSVRVPFCVDCAQRQLGFAPVTNVVSFAQCLSFISVLSYVNDNSPLLPLLHSHAASQVIQGSSSGPYHDLCPTG